MNSETFSCYLQLNGITFENIIILNSATAAEKHTFSKQKLFCIVMSFVVYVDGGMRLMEVLRPTRKS